MAVTEGLYLDAYVFRSIEEVKRVTQEWNCYYSKQTKFINTAKTYQSHRKDDYPNIGWYNVFHKVTHIFGANRCDYA